MSYTVTFKVRNDNYNFYEEMAHDCKEPPYFEGGFLIMKLTEGPSLYIKGDFLEFFTYREVK